MTPIGHRFPHAMVVLLNDTYVVLSTNSLQYSKSLQLKLIQLLKAGEFELKKWSSYKPVIR